jgi:1-acyl-sn-glycerol-3-phosphate acyltransferase
LADAELLAVSRSGDLLYRVLRSIGVGLARVYFRMEIEGRDRLPTVGPFILAPVHRSYVDFLLAGLAVPRRMRFMAKDTLWKWPRFGRFLEIIGAFPVHREGADRIALHRAEATVEGGEPLVMFPEGRRRSGAVVEGLHDGPAFVACRRRVPLVPVAIGGSDRAMPIGARAIRPAKVRIVIGEPIYPDVRTTGRVSRHVVTELTGELNEAMQRLYDDVR